MSSGRKKKQVKQVIQRKQTAPQQQQQNLDDYRQANFKPRDGWKKDGQSKQDEISKDIEEMKKKFEGYRLIPESEYSSVQPGTFIRYLKGGKLYRSGGVLVLNKSPTYWVLQSTDGKKIRWSVPLQDNSKYFRKDPEITRKLEENKQKLYKAVVSGNYVLMKKDQYENCMELMEEQQGGGNETDESSSNWDVNVNMR
jgi:hypothetical protein